MAVKLTKKLFFDTLAKTKDLKPYVNDGGCIRYKKGKVNNRCMCPLTAVWCKLTNEKLDAHSWHKVFSPEGEWADVPLWAEDIVDAADYEAHLGIRSKMVKVLGL